MLPLLLAGCSAVAALGGLSNKSIQNHAPRPAAPAAGQAAADPLAGLNPLPSPQQVLAAVGMGRVDPFAPLPPGPGAAAQVAGAPAGFRFTGVVRSGAQAQALVQFGSLSGSLSAGAVGGRSTDLLPPGWRVAAVDAQRGRLSLQQGSQVVRLDL